MDSRQPQKSPPSVRPRKARWKAWLCALTNPGRVSVSATAVSFQQHGSADSKCPDDCAPGHDPGLRRPRPRLRGRPQLACGDHLRCRRGHRPDRRLVGAAVACGIRVREDRRPARRLAGVDLLGRLRAGSRRARRLPPQGSAGGENGVKAVVMAGGEGTPLRPLTSNQPKPMVPIVGKPCMEHILELLKQHGFDDVIVTLAFMPQAIRSYFGDGDTLGLQIEYSVEESPLGTAGPVAPATDPLDDTFLVISGDALCDVD